MTELTRHSPADTNGPHPRRDAARSFVGDGAVERVEPC